MGGKMERYNGMNAAGSEIGLRPTTDRSSIVDKLYDAGRWARHQGVIYAIVPVLAVSSTVYARDVSANEGLLGTQQSSTAVQSGSNQAYTTGNAIGGGTANSPWGAPRKIGQQEQPPKPPYGSGSDNNPTPISYWSSFWQWFFGWLSLPKQ